LIYLTNIREFNVCANDLPPIYESLGVKELSTVNSYALNVY